MLVHGSLGSLGSPGSTGSLPDYIGYRVVVHDVSEAPELNGCCGVVRTQNGSGISRDRGPRRRADTTPSRHRHPHCHQHPGTPWTHAKPGLAAVSAVNAEVHESTEACPDNSPLPKCSKVVMVDSPAASNVTGPTLAIALRLLTRATRLSHGSYPCHCDLLPDEAGDARLFGIILLTIDACGACTKLGAALCVFVSSCL